MLAAAGCGLKDVVDVTTFHTDQEAQMETVMAGRLAELGAAASELVPAVGVTWLAGFDFEIRVIARVPPAG